MSIAEAYFQQSPLVAIMRGVKPSEVIACAEAIVAAGWRVLEVPLNSPDPLDSIARLAAHFGDRVLVGAGTVLSAQDVEAVAAAGGRLVVAPNTDAAVVGAALGRGMVMLPGVYTPTEAFEAYRLGARYLKLFPADSLGPAYIRAIRSVLPRDAHIVPTGGVSAETIADFHAAGSRAYGIGTQVYKPGMDVAEISRRAQVLAQAAAQLAA